MKISEDQIDYLQLVEAGADPASPAAGLKRLYAKAVGLFFKTSAGIVAQLASFFDVQGGAMSHAVAGGTADAITVTLTPAPTAYTDGMRIFVRASGANTVVNPTLNLNGLGALTITKHGNVALDIGDIYGAGHELQLKYVDAGTDRWELMNPRQADPTLLVPNSKSADYTFVLSDKGKMILHPTADATPRTFTVPANASVPFPIGTMITIVNQNGAGTLTIAITTDTMRLVNTALTGNRTLLPTNNCTLLKITANEWQIGGTGGLS